MAKIVIAEDSQAFINALVYCLPEHEIVGIAQQGDSVEAMVQKTRPDLLLLDLSMPRQSGISVLKKLRSSETELKIIVLTIHNPSIYLEECRKAGADAFLLKDEGRQKLREVVDQVLCGGHYFSPHVETK